MEILPLRSQVRCPRIAQVSLKRAFVFKKDLLSSISLKRMDAIEACLKDAVFFHKEGNKKVMT